MRRDVETELAENGFRWDRFREIFPFGATEYGEGRYQRLVSQVLQRLPDDRQRERLLALLDVQAAAFLEQVWVQNEFFEIEEERRLDEAVAEFTEKHGLRGYRSDAPQKQDPPHMMAGEYASAWLQINENMRSKYGLPRSNARSSMLKLSASESLADRLFRKD